MRFLLPLLLLMSLCLGCEPVPDKSDGGVDGGVDGGQAPSDGGSEQVCARQSTEVSGAGTVTVCEESFAQAPLVRLPADTDVAGGRLVYGGVGRDPSGELSFRGRGVSFAIPPSTPWLDEESRSGDVRYGYFLYRAQVRGNTVESVTRVVRVDDRVFQRMLAGRLYEGVISPRTIDSAGDVRFAWDMQTIGLRIRLDDTPQPDEQDRNSGYPRYALLGRIENATQGVRASDGGCLPSLASFGTQNPLFGATPGAGADRVSVMRHVNMHGGKDDVFTLDWPAGASQGNNMGGGLFVATWELIQPTAPTLEGADSTPHGTPWGGPSATLHGADGGGAICP